MQGILMVTYGAAIYINIKKMIFYEYCQRRKSFKNTANFSTKYSYMYGIHISYVGRRPGMESYFSVCGFNRESKRAIANIPFLWSGQKCISNKSAQMCCIFVESHICHRPSSMVC